MPRLFLFAALAAHAFALGSVKVKPILAEPTYIDSRMRAGPVRAHGKPGTAGPLIVGESTTTEARAPQVAKGPNCPAVNQCSFLDRFETRSDRWIAAHAYANGDPFDCWWSKNRAVIDLGMKKLRLTVDKVPLLGKNFVGGQLQTNKWYGYGCYEVRMKPVAQPGLISTFFAYTGPWDKAPGFGGGHQEIDVEFVWKENGLKLQCNYFTFGKGGNEKYVSLWFDPSKAFHNYAFRWSEGKIEWFVDGKKVYVAWNNVPNAKNGPLKIMMNLWPVAQSAAGWGGKYVYNGARTAVYEGVRFTKGQNCKIANKFW